LADINDEVYLDGEVDDDLALLFWYKVTPHPISLVFQHPNDALDSIFRFYRHIDPTFISLEDKDSTNLKKILGKNY
jgi:hypothetical protein